MALYTKEQIKKADQTNLEEYLQRRGERLKRVGSEFVLIYKDQTGEHDSISVRGNRWYDHKNTKGGYPIRFLQEFYGMGFREAMKELLEGEQPGICIKESIKKEEEKITKEQKNQKENPCYFEKSNFILPKKDNNMKRLFAYLLKTRFISNDVVKSFVDKKVLYQEKDSSNIVFVGMNKDGVPKSASKKSTLKQKKNFKMTVAGSDCNYGFCWRGRNSKLFVFEAGIDLMSFITLKSDDDWKNNSYIALDGVSPKALLRFLEEEKNIKEIYLCLDYDVAGIDASDKIKDILVEKGYLKDNIKRNYPLYKDWNEELKSKNGVMPIFPKSHPKKTAYNAIIRNLGIMNADTESPYLKWREQEYDRKGIDFYMEQIKKDFFHMEKALYNREADTKQFMASILRMVDMSVCLMCEFKKCDNLPKLSMYQNTIQELEDEYKPYLDKARMEERIYEIRNEMECLKNINFQDKSSLFLWAKNIADASVRFAIYLETEYKQELERNNTFMKQKESISVSEEKNYVEQIEFHI